MNLKVKDILNCTNGDLIIGNADFECKHFGRDTRVIQKGDVFVAIKGDNFDGNMFWKEAFDNGADVVIMNKLPLDEVKVQFYNKMNKCIIQVEDTIKALGEMACFKRNLYGSKLKVVGVTGSVGKTSTKDIIASVLSKKYKTLKTEGNKNNFIGLPFTILDLKDEEVAVIEMGMNHVGEISYLSKIAKPDIAVITNIGTSHIGNLGSRENILKAKLEILDGMQDRILVINNDNDLLHKWNLEEHTNINVYTYGIEILSDVNATNLILNAEFSDFICKFKNEEVKIRVPVGGEHFILNSMCAFTVGKLLNLSNEQIIEGINETKLTSKRTEISKLKNNITLVNDSYNASYESMKAAITVLKNMEGTRKIAVLGDMFELGDFSEKLHRNVGKEVYKNNIDKLYLVGEYSKYIGMEVEKLGGDKSSIMHFENKEELLRNLKRDLKTGDTILIKASNGMKLFEVADNLINEFK